MLMCLCFPVKKSICTSSRIETFPRGKQLVWRLDLFFFEKLNERLQNNNNNYNAYTFEEYIHKPTRECRKTRITMASAPLDTDCPF